MADLGLAATFDAVAAAVPDRPALTWRERVLTYGAAADRSQRLAGVMRRHGIGGPHEPSTAPWASHQDRMGLLLVNGGEYLEAMVAAAHARVAAFNINHRYVASELLPLLHSAQPSALVFHGRFAEVLDTVLAQLDAPPRLLLQVDDETGTALLPGALRYEDALAEATPWADPTADPHDVMLLYTGGTTGRPKATVWRQADMLVACLGLRRRDGSEYDGTDEVAAAAQSRRPPRSLPVAPFMHAAALWNALSVWLAGGTVVLPDDPVKVGAADVLDVVERAGASILLLVGDAMAKPLIDEQASAPRDLSSIVRVMTGGAPLSASARQQLQDMLPQARIIDVLGSSETGPQATRQASGAAAFIPDHTTVVLAEGRDRLARPGDTDLGWLARRGRIPLGYLDDEPATTATFATVDGARYSVPGDRARLRPDGSVEFIGRDSLTINTGGEKVFVEEVEEALRRLPAVRDAVVAGAPDDRWGERVVAIVALRDGAVHPDDELREAVAAELARYKLPKQFVRVDDVRRTAAGKPDYVWARKLASAPSDG